MERKPSSLSNDASLLLTWRRQPGWQREKLQNSRNGSRGFPWTFVEKQAHLFQQRMPASCNSLAYCGITLRWLNKARRRPLSPCAHVRIFLAVFFAQTFFVRWCPWQSSNVQKNSYICSVQKILGQICLWKMTNFFYSKKKKKKKLRTILFRDVHGKWWTLKFLLSHLIHVLVV